ncbi:exocyst complex component EXO70A1-like [Gastrolobium bilobum]|uniref:exocyst complex component EXO70A1-like n=1 Tax=Gastrolobium bilobum TaxID=150636 RepID=UPI002AB15655|nr:exocyst complex component EXO70A1-like [Gastrolobium bilobum]
MVDMESTENLEAARKFLTTSLETSSAIASALDESGSRLELLNQRCLSMQASLRFISMQKCSFVNIGQGIDSVLCSAAAVLKVFDSVHQLQHSLLTDPSSDLCTYVTNTKKLEEALKLLTDNCRLAIGWLQGVFEFSQDKAITNEVYLLNVKRCLRILQELQVMEKRARLDGGLLSASFDKLEMVFHRLLIANSMPLPLVSLTSHIGQQASVSTPLLGSLTGKLHAIIERLNANERLDKCQSIYVEVRGINARRSLKTLDLSYLEFPAAELDAQGIESYIDQWGSHLELVVKHLLEIEYRLTTNVFEKIDPEAWMGCFAKIALESGILSFIRFGRIVTERKNEPFKLLNLLDIFRVLNGLRQKFNQLFRGEACEEIRALIKDLVNKVVNGASEIFWQLPAQVKLQRPSSPPPDGSVPKLVSFVTDYCNKLLDDTYRPHLTQVLEIHLSWRKEAYEEGIVFTQIYNIIKEVAVNLDAWSKAYEDITLSYLFMMNNHCHFHNLRGTVLGNMMGDSWLRAHEQYKDYYAALYLGNSWGKLLPILLVPKDILSSSDGIVTSQDLAKRLNAFNLAFDERYKKQSNWVISDEILRENVCKHLVEGIIPIYRAYEKNYSLSIENDGKVAKHIKYTAQSLENRIRSLFQPKLRKQGSIKQENLISKIKEVSNQFRLTLAAL